MKCNNLLKILFFLIIITIEAVHAVEFQKKSALVIGNSRYKTYPLSSPIHDAELISRSLKDIGFNVQHERDIDSLSMKLKIKEFTLELNKNTLGLFYYSGYAVQLNGINYLIPVNTNIKSSDDVTSNGIKIDTIISHFKEAKNKFNMIILDASRDYPPARSILGFTQGLAFTHAPSETFIAFSTAPGNVTSDNKHKHSLFSSSIANNIRIPSIKVGDLFQNIYSSVLLTSKGLQTPWISNSLEDTFYLFYLI